MPFKNQPIVHFLFLVAFISGAFFANPVYAGTLTSALRTSSCNAGEVEVFEMQNTTNSHAGLPAASYNNLVCVGGVAGIGNSCSGTFATVLKLSGTTDAHVRQGTLTDYPNATDACISVPLGGRISVGYAADCSAFDATLGSMIGTTNSHVGNGSWAAGTTKICANGNGAQSLTFNISDNSVGFGTLNTGAARYATVDSAGSVSDISDAQTMTASTTASGGYVVTISGNTLTCAACAGATITAIGATPAASSAGSKQFGLRLIANSGTGSAASPYSGANWALDTGSSPSEVASGPGDGSTTVFGARYIANISALTASGNYSTNLTYTITATY